MLKDVDPAIHPSAHRSVAGRFIFKIALTYLVLYHLEAFLGLLNPVFRVLGAPRGPRALYRIPWDHVASWIGVHLFSLDSALLVPVNGNTDSAIHYARTGCFFLIAIVAALAWTATDRRPDDQSTLRGWLFDFLRYALAIDLFFYGVVKVFPTQMLPVRFFTTGLIRPLGDMSPAGLLWTFVGYSIPYQMLSGAAELLGALLLLSRRTASLGALVSLATVANVVALNLCYDVDVKLFSLNMLVAAMFLAWPVGSALVRLFVFRQAVTPPVIVRWQRPGWPMTAGRLVFTVLFAIYAYQTIVGAYAEFELQARLPATPLYGLYDVESFRKSGEEVPPMTTDNRRWRRVVIESPRVVRVQLMDDSFESYRAEFNQDAARLSLFKTGHPSEPSSVFVWSATGPDHIELDGHAGAEKIALSLRRIDRSRFLLVNRGFHWIQRDSLIQ